MSYTILKSALVFDGGHRDLIENASIAIEDGRIREVREGALKGKGDAIDLKGRFVMPGLLDLHFHAYSISLHWVPMQKMPKTLMVAHAARRSEEHTSELQSRFGIS